MEFWYVFYYEMSDSPIRLLTSFAGNRMIIYFKALAKETGKTWVMHIAVYIAPRMLLRCACQARPLPHLNASAQHCYITVPSPPVLQVGQAVGLQLCQARVARQKDEGHRPRPELRAAVRGGGQDNQEGQEAWWRGLEAAQGAGDHGLLIYVTKGHDNRQMRTVLAKMTAKEQRRLSLRASGKAMREREQLVNLGKMERKPCVKRDENVPECWAHLVPAGVDFTVEGLLLAMVKEEMKPLYSSDGSAAA